MREDIILLSNVKEFDILQMVRFSKKYGVTLKVTIFGSYISDIGRRYVIISIEAISTPPNELILSLLPKSA